MNRFGLAVKNAESKRLLRNKRERDRYVTYIQNNKCAGCGGPSDGHSVCEDCRFKRKLARCK
jgi:hypothetical protein